MNLYISLKYKYFDTTLVFSEFLQMSGYNYGQPVKPSWCRACPGRRDQNFVCTLNTAVCQSLRALWRDF